MAHELVLRDNVSTVPAIISRAGGNARFAYEEFFKATLSIRTPGEPMVGSWIAS